MKRIGSCALAALLLWSCSMSPALLHVAGVPAEHLRAAGVDDDCRNGAIGFARRFGFYAIGPAGGPSGPP